MKSIYTTILTCVLFTTAQAQNKLEATGNAGIGTTAPSSLLEIYVAPDSKPAGVVSPSLSLLKMSRSGTSSFSYPEAAEFRIGHGGPGYYGSRLDLFLNGASNTTSIPDQHAMTWMYNGNVGISTANPRALLDVGGFIENRKLGAVLGRLTEGDGTGEGTFLGVRGYHTTDQVYNSKSFAIEHSFYGQTNSSISFYRGGSEVGGFITFATSQNNEQMRIAANGNVGIGTIAPGEKLSVNGNIKAREVKVTIQPSEWPDYVFENNYALTPLPELEAFIQQHKHLPGMPKAAEAEANGIALGEMNKKLLEKLEELTLHLIEKDKQISGYEKRMKNMETHLQRLNTQFEILNIKK